MRHQGSAGNLASKTSILKTIKINVNFFYFLDLLINYFVFLANPSQPFFFTWNILSAFHRGSVADQGLDGTISSALDR